MTDLSSASFYVGEFTSLKGPTGDKGDIGAQGPSGPAGPQGVPGAGSALLFTDLPAYLPPVGASTILTGGYSTPGVGAALYVATATTGATLYRTQLADGRWFTLAEPSPCIDQFGAQGDDPAFDSWPAVQGCINWNEARGGGCISSDGSKRYYLSQMVEFDPTLTSHEGNGAWWDWSLKNFTNPTTFPELMVNPDLTSGSTGWLTGTTVGTTNAISRGYMSYTGGAVQLIMPLVADVYNADVNGVAYLECGQQIVAPLGSVVRVTFTVDFLRDTRILKTPSGGVTPAESTAASIIALVGNSRGVGEVVTTKTISNTGPISSMTVKSSEFDPIAPEQQTYTFDVVIDRPENIDPFVRIQSNAECKITAMGAKLVPNNTCLLVAAKSDQFGHNRHSWRNLGLHGRDADGQRIYADAVVFNSPQPYSSRVNWFNIQTFNRSFSRAFVFQNAAYLCHFYNCQINARHRGIDTLPNSRDAGENINFHGGTISALNPEAGQDGIAINNPGKMALFFFGVSVDFPEVWYRGIGQVEFHSCWFEKAVTKDASKFMIDVQGGTFLFIGGRIQVDNSYILDGVDLTPVSPFYVGTGATMTLRDVNCSNFGSTTGAWATGPGYFNSTGMRGGAGVPLIATRRADRNIFPDGSFEATSGKIGVECWADSNAAAPTGARVQPDRYTLHWATGGTFTAGTQTQDDIALGTISAVTGSGPVPGDRISGDGILPNAHVITKVGTPATSINMNQKAWKTVAGNACSYVGLTPVSVSNVAVSSAQARTGTKSLKMTKGGGNSVYGQPFRVNVAIPVAQMARTSFEFYYKAVGRALNVGETRTQQTLYINAEYQALVNAGDPISPPVVAQKLYAGYDAPQYIDTVTGGKVLTLVGRTTSGSLLIQDVKATTMATLGVGWPISGTGIPAGATIAALSGTTVTLSVGYAATATAAGVVCSYITPNAWNKVSFTTSYLDPGSLTNGCPPSWATHLVIQLETVNASGLFEVYLDDFSASSF